MKRKKKPTKKVVHHKQIQSQGFQERNKEEGPSRTNKSQWDQALREVSTISSRPASPQTPSMPNGWEDEQLYTDNKATGEFTAGELGAPDREEKEARGPLNEEGEGDRQNDQLAELESDVDAKEDLERRR
jgi:hypothetical protein